MIQSIKRKTSYVPIPRGDLDILVDYALVDTEDVGYLKHRLNNGALQLGITSTRSRLKMAESSNEASI
jgi:hypothetical protein